MTPWEELSEEHKEAVVGLVVAVAGLVLILILFLLGWVRLK